MKKYYDIRNAILQYTSIKNGIIHESYIVFNNDDKFGDDYIVLIYEDNELVEICLNESR